MFLMKFDCTVRIWISSCLYIVCVEYSSCDNCVFIVLSFIFTTQDVVLASELTTGGIYDSIFCTFRSLVLAHVKKSSLVSRHRYWILENSVVLISSMLLKICHGTGMTLSWWILKKFLCHDHLWQILMAAAMVATGLAQNPSQFPK